MEEDRSGSTPVRDIDLKIACAYCIKNLLICSSDGMRGDGVIIEESLVEWGHMSRCS